MMTTRGQQIAGHTGCLVAALLVLAGCATWQPPADLSDAPLRLRAESASAHGVAVSVTVLGSEDSRRMFGADLNADGVQPIWVEVSNSTPDTLWLPFSGTDPEHFSSLEVAWSSHVTGGGNTNALMDEHFERLTFANPIRPGQTRSGIMFTNPQPVAKVVNIDLLGDRKMIPFSFVLDVPDGVGDDAVPALLARPGHEIVDYPDLDSLRVALEPLPHCTTTAADDECSGPLNMILIGTLENIGTAISRRGYRRQFRDTDLAQVVFGRPPDYVARRWASANTSSAWIRAWRAPVSYRGQPVFVAQAARPLGGRFAPDAGEGAPMHGDVDEARDAYLQDSAYSGGLEAIGFLRSVGAIPEDAPRVLADDTSYHTDGMRLVMFYSIRPLTFADVSFLDWAPVGQLSGNAPLRPEPAHAPR